MSITEDATCAPSENFIVKDHKNGTSDNGVKNTIHKPKFT